MDFLVLLDLLDEEDVEIEDLLDRPSALGAEKGSIGIIIGILLRMGKDEVEITYLSGSPVEVSARLPSACKVCGNDSIKDPALI